MLVPIVFRMTEKKREEKEKKEDNSASEMCSLPPNGYIRNNRETTRYIRWFRLLIDLLKHSFPD